MKVRNKVKAKMANTFKKIIKKHKKKKLQAERNRKAKARERADSYRTGLPVCGTDSVYHFPYP